MSYKVVAVITFEWLVGEQRFGMLGVVPAALCRFLYFGSGRRQSLPHFSREYCCPVVNFSVEDVGCGIQPCCSASDVGVSELFECLTGFLENGINCHVCHRLKAFEKFFCRWISSLDAH